MARRNSSTLQDSLDDENRGLLASLEQEHPKSPASTGSPKQTSPTSPYYRSTLSVDTPTPRHGSIAGIGVGVTSPNTVRKKKLDPSDPSTWTTPAASSNEMRPRASSESQKADVPSIYLQTESDSLRPRNSTNTNTSTLAPSPGISLQRPGSLDAVLNNDRDSALQSSIYSPYTASNTSASTNTGIDSSTVKHMPPSSPKSLAVEGDSPELRRYSDQSAAYSTTTEDSDRISAIARGDSREDEEPFQDSSEDERSSSDQDEESPVARRGRRRKSSTESAVLKEGTAEASNKTPAYPKISVSDMSVPRSEQPHPMSESGKLSETQGAVAPRSNYNRASVSPAALSAFGDDDNELKRAKALELRVSPLDEKIKDRSVKMLIRGEWSAYQDHENEEQEIRHEPRLYLVCSDLSNEASYALEWTVGTLLKDGDTVLIMSAIEDENAARHKDHEEPTLEVRLESAKAAEEASSTMVSLTRQTTNQEGQSDSKSRLASLNEPARSVSRSGRTPTKKDEERNKAVDKIENDFLRYVRKTTLQVRCMIEVIHCRNSKHLILNAIDELEPTLVVVGTRGQNQLKNVMLGSFSNYLVTKSSIPVMVARKRLKKTRHAKVSSQQIRMTNNLTPVALTGKRKSLTQARID